MRSIRLFAAIATVALVPVSAAQADDPEPATPNFNLEVILRPAAGAVDAFGLVKFRQPKDDAKIIYLDTWVRDLAPNHPYYLQRAVDTNVNDDCAGTGWLTLGQGPVPEAVVTDERGIGQAALYRDLSALPLGAEFDIHFRVIDAMTSAVVLESACYQFTVSQ